MADYYAEKAKKELERRKARAQALAEAWQAIERYKTKDGKDYKNIALNFTKGAVRPDRYNPQEKTINVSGYADGNGYVDDYIDISPTVYHDSEEAKKYEAEGRLIERGEYIHPYINLTPDEIEKAIAGRVAHHNDVAKQCDAVLENFDEIAGKLIDLRQQAERLIQTQPGTAYFILRNIFREQD